MIHVDDWSIIDNSLHIVSKKGDLEQVKSMCDAGINPAAAIMNAASHGYVEMMQYLLTIPNVDPTIWDNAPINDACRGGHLGIVKMLSTNNKVRNTILAKDILLLSSIASQKGYTEIAQLLHNMHV